MKKNLALCATLALVVWVGCAALASSAFADSAPVGVLTVGPAQEVSGTQPEVPTPARPAGAFINRPTMPMSTYRAEKAAADANQGTTTKPGAATPSAPSGPSVPNASGFQGINQSQSDGFFPPDVNGVVGGGFNVLITNDRYVVYTKAVAPVIKKNTSLNTFFSYATEQMFDPRVVYDPVWKRFISEADSFEESASTQIIGISISKGSDPTGGTWNYLLNGKQICGNGVFVDYPQISTTQDAVLETVNCYRDSDGVYLGSRSFAVAKSILYNGLGFSVPVFSPGNATATPPNVLDGNPRAHLLVA